MNYFDWDKALKIIEKYPNCCIDAGMDEDWFWTADTIYDGKRRVKNDVWTDSVWATPVCRVCTDEGILTIPCYTTKKQECPCWWPEKEADA